MAYDADVSYEPYSTPDGDKFTIVTVVETGVTAATDEWTADVPAIGQVTAHTCALTAGNGTATTVDPRIGEVAAGAEVLDNGSAAASTRDRTNRPYFTHDSKLRGSSRADGTTGTTGSITTRVVVKHGH